ncbi:hypothetical protein PC129_g3535 [Phytophthora cactorum]|uniref:Uncharacterized protein n=1 Tax=Phytophthora cactorum TaxID=29920 RepID=A0A8T1IQH8_9STRA|nr:hypothetical protein PC129_g3535 [Phytophthora cactorum]
MYTPSQFQLFGDSACGESKLIVSEIAPKRNTWSTGRRSGGAARTGADSARTEGVPHIGDCQARASLARRKAG